VFTYEGFPDENRRSGVQIISVRTEKRSVPLKNLTNIVCGSPMVRLARPTFFTEIL
jgi:hypothetical protein